MHRNEDPKDGACREVLEEIGLELQPNDIEKLTSGFTKYFFGGKRFVIYRLVLKHKPEICLTPELNGYFWVTRGEINDYKITNEVVASLAASSTR